MKYVPRCCDVVVTKGGRCVLLCIVCRNVRVTDTMWGSVGLEKCGLAYLIQTSKTAQPTRWRAEITDTVLGFGVVVSAMVCTVGASVMLLMSRFLLKISLCVCFGVHDLCYFQLTF